MFLLPPRMAFLLVLAALDLLGGGLLVWRGTAIGASWWQGGNGAHCCSSPGDEGFRSFFSDGTFPNVRKHKKTRQHRVEGQRLYKTSGIKGLGRSATKQRGKAEAVQNKGDRMECREKGKRLYKTRGVGGSTTIQRRKAEAAQNKGDQR